MRPLTTRDNLPPKHLRIKPLPEWTHREREAHEPDGYVWDRDGQRWIRED